MSKRYPIEKGLTGDGKVYKAGPVALDKRQGHILFASLAVYWLLYKQLSRVIPLTTFEALLVFCPLLGVAALVAFVRIDGRHIDHWVLKALQHAFSQKTLLWKRLPDRAGANLAATQAVEASATSKGPAPAKPGTSSGKPGSDNPSTASGGPKGRHNTRPDGNPNGTPNVGLTKKPKPSRAHRRAQKKADKARAKARARARKRRSSD